MNQKINNIQGLRAFAAFIVVLYHGSIHLPYMETFGTFGVDIFFVISGYIMARICETNPSFFLRRRLIRIVPPYWAFTTLLFLVAFKHPEWMGATAASWTDYCKSLFFIPYYKSNGLMRPLLFVGWSLNYEMFFYLVITAGLLVYRRHALWIASGLILLTLAVCLPFTSRSAIFDFYSNGQMLEFLFGILAYEVARRIEPSMAVRLRVLSLAAFTAALVALLWHHGIAPVHWYKREWAFSGVASFFLILSASLLSQGDWDLRMGWIVLIGDASYILYLIHTYIEYTYDRVIEKRVHFLQAHHTPAHLAAVLATVPIAIALHLWVEKPVVTLLNRRFGGHRPSTEMSGHIAAPAEVAPQARAS